MAHTVCSSYNIPVCMFTVYAYIYIERERRIIVNVYNNVLYVIGERAQQTSLGTWSLNCAVLYISIILCVHIFLIGTDMANVPV